MSKRSAALVGAAGMKERNRGLSQDTTAVANSSTKSRKTSAASLPSGRIRPVSTEPSPGAWPPKSSGTGSRARSLLAIGHHEVGHGLVVVEHRPGGVMRAEPSRRRALRVHRRASAAMPLRPATPPRAPAARSPPRSAPRRRTRAWPARGRLSCARSMPSTVTSSKVRAAGQRSAAVARTPKVPVVVCMTWRSGSRCAESVSTCRTWPGRPFFMVTELTQASKAPASRAADTA